MYTIAFPYKQRKFDLLPIIPITLFGPRLNLQVEAYVDSGAFYTIFDTSVSELLELDLRYGRERMFVVGDGSFIPAKIVKMPIKIGDEKFLAELAFSNKLNIGFNLLGRKGIFEYFDEVAFLETKKAVEFRMKSRNE